MKLVLSMLAVIVAVSYAHEDGPGILDEDVLEWTLYKTGHDKSYTSVENVARYKIWKANKVMVEAHNKEFEEGLTTFKMAINKFSDLTHTEYLGLNGYRQQKPSGKGTRFFPPLNVEIPEEVDWRKQGYVTEVKDQGQCGSCWAFSTTGSLEGQHKRKTGHLVSLSEQMLVDCDHKDQGCHGGLMTRAFTFIAHNGGIDTEKSYPYTAEVGDCNYNASHIGAKDSGYTDIPTGHEDLLKAATATQGPISVAIDAGHTSFQHYHSGVYKDANCSSTDLDHGVLVVGYGVDKGTHFWLVKNSWGANWGESGYIKMARDAGNMCGIATLASFPIPA